MQNTTFKTTWNPAPTDEVSQAFHKRKHITILLNLISICMLLPWMRSKPDVQQTLTPYATNPFYALSFSKEN